MSTHPTTDTPRAIIMVDGEEFMRLWDAKTDAEDFSVVGRYIPRPKLERAVKRYWRAQMMAGIKAGRAAR